MWERKALIKKSGIVRDGLLEKVGNHFRIDVKELKSQSRSRDIAKARSVLCCLWNLESWITLRHDDKGSSGQPISRERVHCAWTEHPSPAVPVQHTMMNPPLESENRIGHPRMSGKEITDKNAYYGLAVYFRGPAFKPGGQSEKDMLASFLLEPEVTSLFPYWKPEEGMESDLSVFFDAAAEDNLPTVGIYTLATGMVAMFEKVVQSHGSAGP